MTQTTLEPINQARLAHLAGVSRTTVSRALANDPRISDKVADRIRRLARRHNYRPNAAARSIVNQRNNAIGFVVCDRPLTSSTYGLMAAAVERWSRQNDYHLHLSLCDTADLADDELPPIFREVGIDGVILTGAPPDSLLNRLTNWRMPTVLLGSQPGIEGVNQVSGDQRQGGKLITSHLIQAGHRHIGALIGPLKRPTHANYLQGMKDALAEASIDPDSLDDGVEICTSMDVIEPMRRLLARKPELTAVFADTDMVAWHVVQYLRTLGIDVPGKISVAGAGGGSRHTEIAVQLTSVDINVDDMARAAATLLQDVMQHRQSNARRVVIEPGIIAGQTVQSI